MKTTPNLILILLLLLGLYAIAVAHAAPAVPGRPVVGVASVIDGDTLIIHGTKIRLHGVDAPESSQLCYQMPARTPWRCGQKAALALSDLIGRRPVSCQPRDSDRYGRLIAVCKVGSLDINAWMVGNGWAVAYVRYSQEYVASETRARASSRGIWGSAFDAPWNYRASQRKD